MGVKRANHGADDVLMEPTGMPPLWRRIVIAVGGALFVALNFLLLGWRIGVLAVTVVASLGAVLAVRRFAGSGEGGMPGYRVMMIAVMTAAWFAGIYFAARSSGSGVGSAIIQAAVLTMVWLVVAGAFMIRLQRRNRV
jgi:cation transport ATPase